MILSQIWHGLLPYESSFYLLIQPFTSLAIYLPITHPPTYLLTYIFSPTYIPTYIFHFRM
jgi:hypothetical protein